MVCPVVSTNNPSAHGDSSQSHPIANAPDDEAIHTGGSLRLDQALAYLKRIAVALETLAANGLPIIQPDIASKAPRKRHSRGAKRKDAEGDPRIYEAWQTGHHATWKECGKALGRDERDVELAVGRYRKYLQRHRRKG
jgi:hypothetical protein